jgi:hypothetical protein
MMAGVDEADCPAFELLATAYHEAAHAVGAALVSPQLIVESATIVSGDGYLGRVTFEDWSENIIPDPYDEDLGEEICEHERQYLAAEDTVSLLGGLVEGYFRTGRLDAPTPAGWGDDRDDVLRNAHAQMEDDIWHKTGHGRGWLLTAHDPAAVALIARHSYFWLAVGLVAGALMRQLTLDGWDVTALVREARDRQ